MTYRIYQPTKSECHRLNWSFYEEQFVIISDTGYYWYTGISALCPKEGWPALFSNVKNQPFSIIKPKAFDFIPDCLIATITPQTHPELFI